MIRDPRRLYAPGRLYHIVERKPFRYFQMRPPQVVTEHGKKILQEILELFCCPMLLLTICAVSNILKLHFLILEPFMYSATQNF